MNKFFESAMENLDAIGVGLACGLVATLVLYAVRQQDNASHQEQHRLEALRPACICDVCNPDPEGGVR